MIIEYSDALIKQPCFVRGMPIDVYHGQPCAGPSVSTSNLKRAYQLSPKHLYEFWSGNPNRSEESRTDWMRIGAVAHYLMLEDRQRFWHWFATPPEEVLGRNGARSTNAYREWAAALPSHVMEISQKTLSTGLAMAEAMRRWREENPGRIPDRVFGGDLEFSGFAPTEYGGLWLKTRPDVMPEAGFFCDLKTTSKIAPDDFERQFFTLGYDLQVAIADEVLRACDQPPVDLALWIVQETEPPYDVATYTLARSSIDEARDLLHSQLRIIGECIKSGRWPGVSPVLKQLEKPKWLK